MLALISETPTITFPKELKTFSGRRNNCRYECVLQTVGVVNRNKRRYSKDVINEGLERISDRIKEGSLLGELDHPIDRNPIRQVTVLYKEASHRILDYGWDGNKLLGIVEVLRTRNGRELQALIDDGVPIGFSFRGMGDLRQVHESGTVFYDVLGPIHIVTWDAVNTPSHADAKLLRKLANESVGTSKNVIDKRVYYLTEDDLNKIIDYYTKKNIVISEECLEKGIICTPEGVCYLFR